ncbi:MAG: His/Gly/Thr/Pro-type tRNA ligase C-terminal domain-containing protein, partial [Eubacteriaceae bacterium]
PFCVTVDFDSLEDGAVTLRDRDTMNQVRLPITEVAAYINERIAF